jgi:putative tricarboxylic transport membrane protein
LVGYVLRSQGFLPAPMLIGFVLTPMLEENLRRGMLMGRGDPFYFVSSPMSIGAVILTICLVILPAVALWRRGRSAP